VERTIALRPYPALKLFRDAMYASLKDKLPPDVWDYPTPWYDYNGAGCSVQFGTKIMTAASGSAQGNGGGLGLL
jgi:hypothetical protein